MAGHSERYHLKNPGNTDERLARKKPPLDNKIEHLRALVSGFETGQVFLTALELDVFSHIQKPRTAGELSAALGTDADLTEKFLNVLCAMQLLKKKDGKYGNAPETAPFLVKDSLYFGRYLRLDNKAKAHLLGLKQILKNGPLEGSEKHEHQFNPDAMDWIARLSLLGRLQGTVKQVTALPEFSHARKLIDLGGGHGLFGIAFAQENPDLRVVVFDKPAVIPTTQAYIDQYRIGKRVSVMSGDYTADDFGCNYDIVFEACSFGGNDQTCKSFFRKVAAALKNDGLFIRLTFTLDDDKMGPLEPLLWELKNSLAGRNATSHRTHTELLHLYGQSGLRGEKIIDMSPWCFNPMRLIISRKM